MTKTIKLELGTVVTLASNGTLVYIDAVLPAYVEVVALPDQPDTREDERVFQPGAVRAKKISPFSSPETTCLIADLTEDNQTFIRDLEQLRKTHGQKHIVGEQNQMTVRKETGRRTGSSKKTARRKLKCAKCGQQPGHPNHPGVHEFEEPVRKAKASKPTGPYHIVSTDLSALQASSDKWKPGNRFQRVFLALQTLPESTGTFEQIVVALVTDGARAITNPDKVARRALKQLVDSGTVEQSEQTANTDGDATNDPDDEG